MPQRKLIVSPRARGDVKEIGRYTERTWGITQRDRYLKLITERFKKLLTRPRLGRLHPDLGDGVWYTRMHMHNIFYVFDDDQVEIVTVLHTRMDPKLHI